MPAALVSLDPDVIVLNEYVERPDPKGHNYLCECLKQAGFGFIKMSEKHSSPHPHNRVFIASRTPIEPRKPLADDAGTLQVGSRNLHVHAASNHLHVYLPEYELSIIGLRVPELRGEEIDAYWGWFTSEVNKLLDRRIIIIGDFNADPRNYSPKSKGLVGLLNTNGGWTTKNPTGDDWSYMQQTNNGSGPSRIDHVLSSMSVKINTAEYIIQTEQPELYTFVQKDWSDHAVLSVQLDCQSLPPEKEATDAVAALA